MDYFNSISNVNYEITLVAFFVYNCKLRCQTGLLSLKDLGEPLLGDVNCKGMKEAALKWSFCSYSIAAPATKLILLLLEVSSWFLAGVASLNSGPFFFQCVFSE